MSARLGTGENNTNRGEFSIIDEDSIEKTVNNETTVLRVASEASHFLS